MASSTSGSSRLLGRSLDDRDDRSEESVSLSYPSFSSSFSASSSCSCLRSTSSSSLGEEIGASAAANFFRVRAKDRVCRDVAKLSDSGLDWVILLLLVYLVVMLEILEVRIVSLFSSCKGQAECSFDKLDEFGSLTFLSREIDRKLIIGIKLLLEKRVDKKPQCGFDEFVVDEPHHQSNRYSDAILGKYVRDPNGNIIDPAIDTVHIDRRERFMKEGACQEPLIFRDS